LDMCLIGVGEVMILKSVVSLPDKVIR
jgi:hypothetical protein